MNYEGALTIIVYINKATIINFCDIDVSLKICVFCWAIVFVTLLLSVQRLGKQAPPPTSLTPLKKECLRVSKPSQCHLPYSDPSDFPFKRSFNISLRKKMRLWHFCSQTKFAPFLVGRTAGVIGRADFLIEARFLVIGAIFIGSKGQ